ncbi:hypothetical protein AAVH_11108 [Aphelenchoides avenae]|nr:hypothetical protein AAVH_11108 [Aphelenchus avenae]
MAMLSVWIIALLACGVQFADADDSSNQSCVTSCFDNLFVVETNSTNNTSEQNFCRLLELATCMEGCEYAANMSAIISVLMWAMRPICPAGTDDGRYTAYVAEYKAIGNRLQDLPDGYLPEECRMSSFKLIRSPIDAMCRRHHCLELMFNRGSEKTNTPAGPVVQAMFVLASLRQYTNEYGWSDVSKHQKCMLGFAWTDANETSYDWPPSDPTSHHASRHDQLQADNVNHALDGGTDVLAGARLVPLESILKTDSFVTQTSNSLDNGGEQLSHGRSENVTIGPLFSLELKLDRLIELQKKSLNMLTELTRSNKSGNHG